MESIKSDNSLTNEITVIDSPTSDFNEFIGNNPEDEDRIDIVHEALPECVRRVSEHLRSYRAFIDGALISVIFPSPSTIYKFASSADNIVMLTTNAQLSTEERSPDNTEVCV